MELSSEKKSETEVLLTVRLSPKDYIKAFEARVTKYAQQYVLQGFRENTPAKKQIIERKYGQQILEELILEKAQRKVAAYKAKQSFVPISPPIIDYKALNDIDWRVGLSFSIPFFMDIAPDFSLVIDKNLVVEQPPIQENSSENIRKALGLLQHLYTTVEKTDRVRQNCFVFIQALDAEGEAKEGQKFYYINPEFEYSHLFQNRLTGENLLAIASTLPEAEWHAFLEFFEIQKEDSLRGLYITEVYALVPVILNREKITELLSSDKELSLDDLEGDIKELVIQEVEREKERMFVRHIQEALVKHANISLPERYKEVQFQLSKALILNKISKESQISIEENEVSVDIIGERLRSKDITKMSASQPAEVVYRRVIRFFRGKRIRTIYSEKSIAMFERLVSYWGKERVTFQNPVNSSKV